MRHVLLALSAATALIAGCKDLPRQTPTEVEPPSSALESRSPMLREGGSTLCAAYEKRLGESRVALAASPGDPALRDAVATYETVIADACTEAAP